MTPERFNGSRNSQKQIIITNPTCFNATSLSNIGSGCHAAARARASTSDLPDRARFHAPYTQQLGRQPGAPGDQDDDATLTYLHSFGVHQMATRDSNAYLPGTILNTAAPRLPAPRPNPILGHRQRVLPRGSLQAEPDDREYQCPLTPKFSVMGSTT